MDRLVAGQEQTNIIVLVEEMGGESEAGHLFWKQRQEENEGWCTHTSYKASYYNFVYIFW